MTTQSNSALHAAMFPATPRRLDVRDPLSVDAIHAQIRKDAAEYIKGTDKAHACTVSEFREWGDVPAFVNELKVFRLMREAHAALPTECNRCEGTGHVDGEECLAPHCHGGSNDYPLPTMGREYLDASGARVSP